MSLSSDDGSRGSASSTIEDCFHGASGSWGMLGATLNAPHGAAAMGVAVLDTTNPGGKGVEKGNC
jgi:hypothetical protein